MNKFRAKTVNDEPLELGEQADLLDNKRYTDGLFTFLQECETPMTVAIQGGWGSGKTTIINTLVKKFGNTPSIATITFNTWQYDQFGKSDRLFNSLFLFLMKKMQEQTVEKNEIQLDTIVKFGLSSILGLTKIGVASVIPNGTQTIDEVTKNYEKYFKEALNEVDEIAKQKEEFKIFVDKMLKAKGKERFIIFIDDLDRLNPKTAVEFLEAIKLLLDVEKCVFVLAVDYDVVVKGVRIKYGNEMTTAKCRDFFEKIIQVPFCMPEADYSAQNIIHTYLFSDKAVDSDNIVLTNVSEFIDNNIGANPRNLKRMINAFVLIRYVKKDNENNISDKDGYIEDLMIFLTLSLQHKYPELYTFILLNPETWCEYIKKYLSEDIEINSEKTVDKTEEIAIRNFRNSMETVPNANKEFNKLIAIALNLSQMFDEISKHKEGGTKVMTAFKKAMTETKVVQIKENSLSTIRNKSTQIQKVSLSLSENSNKNSMLEVKDGVAIDALIKSIELILSNLNSETIDLILKELSRDTNPVLVNANANVQPDNFTNGTSVYRIKKDFTIMSNDNMQYKLFIGGSTGLNGKKQQLKKILATVNTINSNNKKTITWYYDDGATEQF